MKALEILHRQEQNQNNRLQAFDDWNLQVGPAQVLNEVTQGLDAVESKTGELMIQMGFNMYLLTKGAENNAQNIGLYLCRHTFSIDKRTFMREYYQARKAVYGIPSALMSLSLGLGFIAELLQAGRVKRIAESN